MENEKLERVMSLAEKGHWFSNIGGLKRKG
jgi:hypothetical protein